MATYSQDSQRLVMVGKTANAGATSTDLISDLAVGEIGLFTPAGAIIATGTTPTAAAPFIIAMGTGKPAVGNVIGATNTLALVSEVIRPGMATQGIVKTAAAPALQKSTVDVGTAIPNNEYYITLDFDGYGSTSAQNTVQVYAVFVSTSVDTPTTIADGLVANFNKNASRTGTARASAANVAGVITFTAEQQAVIDFQNMFHVVRFTTSLNDTFATDAVLTENTVAGSKGFGYGPEVANIEHFAQGSEANWTWNKYPEMYPRDLYTDTSVNYDCDALRLETTKTGFGSNITSKRQIEVFVDEAAAADGATGLFAAINALAGV